MCGSERLLGHPLVLLVFGTNLGDGDSLDIPAGILDESPELLKLLGLLYHFHQFSIIFAELLIFDLDDPLPEAPLPHIQILIQSLQLTMLPTQLIVLFHLRGHVPLQRVALIPVGLCLPLILQLLLLQVRDVLAHRDNLLGEAVEAPLVSRPVLRLSLHQVLVVHHQVLYFRLETLVRVL